MTIFALAATAVACVAMFQAPQLQNRNNDVLYLTNGLSLSQLFDTQDLSTYSGTTWYFTNAGASGSVLFSNYGQIHGRELWTSNGTTAGTRILKDINAGANFWSNPGGPSNPSSVPNGGTAFSTRFQKVGSRIVFPATSFAKGRELWTSDGTGPGTILLRDHIPGAGDGIDDGTIEFVFSNGTFAVYLANDVLRGESLWATFGTPQSTRFLVEFPDYETPGPMGLLGHRILFGRNQSRDLWITDGTPSGTKLVTSFVGTRPIQNISRIKDTPYALMSVYNSTYGQELWITDGTKRGTRILKNINLNNAGSDPGVYSRDAESGRGGAYFKIGNKIVFPATDDPNRRELWVTQGTAATTMRISNLVPNVGSADFYGFTVRAGRAYFSAKVVEAGGSYIRPFVTDGTALGTRKLSNSLRVTGRMVSLWNTVVFPAYRGSDHFLWRTGPTENSQVMISPLIARPLFHFQAVNIPTAGQNRPCPPG